MQVVTDHSSVWLSTRKSRKYVVQNLIPRRGFSTAKRQVYQIEDEVLLVVVGFSVLVFCQLEWRYVARVCYSLFSFLTAVTTLPIDYSDIDLTATSVMFFSKMPMKRRWAVVLRLSLVHLAKRLAIQRSTDAGLEKIVCVMGLADSAVSSEVTYQRRVIDTDNFTAYHDDCLNGNNRLGNIENEIRVC